MKPKKVAIVGASGYSGEELVRLLLHHPDVELSAVTSRQSAGQTIAQVFQTAAKKHGLWDRRAHDGSHEETTTFRRPPKKGPQLTLF